MNGMNRFWCLLTLTCALGITSVTAQNESKLNALDSSLYAGAKNNKALLQALAAEHTGEHLGFRAMCRLSYLLYQEGNDTAAERGYLDVYRQSLNSHESHDASYYLSKIYLSREDYSNAKRFLKECIAASKNEVQVEMSRYYLVRVLMASNDQEASAAIDQYSALPKKATANKDVIILHDMVKYFAGKQDYSRAITEAKKLIARYPKSKYVHDVENKIVDCELMQGHTQAAIDYTKQLLAKYKANTNDAASAQNLLGTIYANLGKYEMARAELKKVASKHPAAVERVRASEYLLAVVDMQEGNAQDDSVKTKSAMTKFQAFAEAHPSDRHTPMAWMNAANICTRLGKTNEAYMAYNNIIAFDTSRLSNVKDGKSKKELKEYRELALKAQLAKGKALLKNKTNYSQSLSDFDAVLAAQPNNAEAKLNKARCLIEMNRKNEAKKILKELADEPSKVQETAKTMLAKIR